MPIERIPTDQVPGHLTTGFPVPVHTGINTDTDTGAALFVGALCEVYVLVRVSTSPRWYQADTLAAAADFYGRLMSTDAWIDPDVLAQRVTEDETACPVCRGVIAPEGVTLVPEDGEPCTCNAPGSENVRYWVDGADTEDGHARPYGHDTVGIVDNEEGGVIAYVHRLTADRIISALQAADAAGED